RETQAIPIIPTSGIRRTSPLFGMLWLVFTAILISNMLDIGMVGIRCLAPVIGPADRKSCLTAPIRLAGLAGRWVSDSVRRPGRFSPTAFGVQAGGAWAA